MMFIFYFFYFWFACIMLSCSSLVSASHNPLMVLLFLATAKTSKFSSLKNLPPVAVDMQMDFEISTTPAKPKEEISRSKPVATTKKTKKTKKPKKIVSKNYIATKKPAVAPPKKSPRPPPPPPSSPKLTKTKEPADSAHTRNPEPSPKHVVIKKKPSTTLSINLKRNISFSLNRIAQHKYAKVVWASLLFVWAPLLVIFVLNSLMGKEVFIEFLVNILPDNFPASWIETAVEDGLWLGIFGLSIIVATGTFLVEMATLVVDIAKSSPQNSKSSAGKSKS